MDIHSYRKKLQIALTVQENILESLTDRQTDRQIPYACYMADMLGIDRRIDKENKHYQKLKKGIIPSGRPYGSEIRLKRLTGELLDHNGNKSQFCHERYGFFLDAPFETSDKCCNVMKKKPAKEYEKTTGRKPIIATMACESRMRTQKWLQEGCNAFESSSPKSKPMSFWTEQDVLLYIHENNLPIASVYGEVIKDYEGMGQLEGQIDMSELGIFDIGRPLLRTTGCTRTGCMFCGFGCHLEKSPNRFERMKETHPKQYDYIMRPTEQGGLNYKEVIDWINEHGDMNIKY